MADVRPFAGLRFTHPLADVIAPPYDVISPAEQDALYERSPYNVVRLELGREADRYAAARTTYQGWRQEGALRPDPPSLYLYEQRFTPPSGRPGQADGVVSRRGLIARVKLEPWSAGVILPHEETLTKPKADRLDLMRALGANVSPVFALYEDPSGDLARMLAPAFIQPPLAQATDDADEAHRLWQVPEGELSQSVHQLLADRPLFIADGHHRYETALAYRDERAATGGTRDSTSDAPADFVMMALVDFADSGLVVLPTHRLLRDLTPRMLRALAENLAAYFDVVAAAESPSPRAVAAALSQLDDIDGPAFVLYGPLPSGLRVIQLKQRWRGTTFDEKHSAAWNALDVAVLHSVVGGRILGIAEEDLASQSYFSYTRQPEGAIRQVQSGEAQLALLLRPTPPQAIRDISLAKDKMPQKSTYFYPKLATGLVINPL
ncbi:MAG: DUF1015 domain-containing protein [Chloroflexota bacterium]